MKTRRTLIIITVFVVAFVWTLTPPFAHFLAQEYLIQVQNQGVKVRVDGLQGRRIGLEADGIEGWTTIPVSRIIPSSPVRAFPLSLKSEKTVALLKFPLFTPWAPSLYFDLLAYDGHLEGEIRGVMGAPSLDLKITGLDLSRHPQVSALGVESGVLAAEVKGHPLKTLPGSEALYSVDVSGLSLALPSNVRTLIRIDSISNGTLSARASLQRDGTLSVSSCRLTSSLGSVSFTAKALLQNGTLREIAGNGVFDLSTEEGSRLRPFLGLLVSSSELASNGPIRCAFRGTSCGGTARMQVKVGTECIKIDCGA